MTYAVTLQVSEFSHDLLDNRPVTPQSPTLSHLDHRQWRTELHLDLHNLVNGNALELRKSQVLQARFEGHQLRAHNSLSFPEFQARLVKEVPNIWRVHWPGSWQSDPVPIRISSLQQPPMVIEMTPWIQRTKQLPDGSTIIEGGVRLTIDPGLITRDGITKMQLTIDLQSH